MEKDKNHDPFSFDDLQKKIGYYFKNKSLMETALTHPSYRFEHSEYGSDNQRLEFLGDAVLGFIISDLLYKSIKGDEGILTERRTAYVKGSTLSKLALEIGLGSHLKLGVGEIRSAGNKRESTLADAMEALIGAIYLDGGINSCRRLVKRLLFSKNDLFVKREEHSCNPKGDLQQYCQLKWRTNPIYSVVNIEGPAHLRVFTVEVRLPDGTQTSGIGPSRKSAEAKAALKALESVNAKLKVSDGSLDGKVNQKME